MFVHTKTNEGRLESFFGHCLCSMISTSGPSNWLVLSRFNWTTDSTPQFTRTDESSSTRHGQKDNHIRNLTFKCSKTLQYSNLKLQETRNPLQGTRYFILSASIQLIPLYRVQRWERVQSGNPALATLSVAAKYKEIEHEALILPTRKEIVPPHISWSFSRSNCKEYISTPSWDPGVALPLPWPVGPQYVYASSGPVRAWIVNRTCSKRAN